MPTDYTGDKTATEAPAAPPALGVAPITRIPNDGEAANVASILQEIKVLADYVAFLTDRPAWGPGGSGSDGDLTVAGTNHLIGGLGRQYNNLTIGAAGQLIVDTPQIIRVKGTLNIAAGGKLIFGNPAALKGGDASGAANGAAGVGWNSLGSGLVLGGADGGGGTADDGDPVTDSLGGSGGGGGAGSGAGGGLGGVATALAQGNAQDLLTLVLNAGWGFKRSGSYPAMSAAAFGVQGGAGGASGGAGSFTGGGGAGGATGILLARKIIVAADGAIQAPGGAGGAGHSGGGFGGGSGGGGGGGFLGIACLQYAGPALTAAACVPGGTSPAAPGPGVAGGVGTLAFFVTGI